MKRRLSTAALLTLAVPLAAQVVTVPDPLSQRTTDRLRFAPALQLMTPTRHAPLVRARGLGTWAASRFMLFEDGYPLPAMPLNFDSPDVASLDVLVIDSLRLVERPALVNGTPVFGGALLVSRKQIPDSLVVAARAFAGSETGDPALYVYTRDALPLGNRQKIGTSASALVSNRSGDFAYRIHGASFGHFATGYASTDPLISAYRSDLGRDQSTTRFVRGEASLRLPGGSSLDGELAVHGVRGWDMLPFIPTFVHYDFLRISGSIRMRDTAGGFSLCLRGDLQTFKLDEQLRSAGGEFRLQELTLEGSWNVRTTPSTVLSFGGRGVLHALVLPARPPGTRAQLFSDEFSRWSGLLSVRFRSRSGTMAWVASATVERLLEGEIAGSVGGGGEWHVGEEQRLELSFASVTAAPSPIELYGRYEVHRERYPLGRVDTFVIGGNSSLRSQRAQSLDLNYVVAQNGRQIVAGLFLLKMLRPVALLPAASIRSARPGDVVWSGMYVHQPNRFLWGGQLSCVVPIATNATASVHYQYVDHRTARDVPRHSVGAIAELNLLQGMTIAAGVTGQSRTVWEEFRVRPQDDDLLATGIDVVLPERWLLDVSVTQRLSDVWFVRSVDVRAELQNVLDRKYRLLPIGNDLSMAALAYISVGF